MKRTQKLLNEQDIRQSILNISASDKKMELLKNFLGRIYDEDSVNNIMSLLEKLSDSPSDSPKKSKNDSNIIYTPVARRYGYILPPNALDLNDPKEFETYRKIAQDYISTRSSNLLGITGSMMATAAKNAFNKHGNYVPPELALSQLAQEGGFSPDPNARPIRTKNPFNVGNVDSGSNVFKTSVMGGIQTYYDLIASKYLIPGRQMEDLLTNFVNTSGNRYASDTEYEKKLQSIISRIQPISQKFYAEIKKSDSDRTQS
jgi:hypothetical protein